MAKEGREDRALLCDTNVLVRLLTDAPTDQAEAAARVLERAAHVVLTDVIVAELAYVMTDVYGLSKASAAERIWSVITLPAIEVADEHVLRDALDLWASIGGLDFADAYLAALHRGTRETAVLSNDADFDKIDHVERVDPARY